MEFCKSREYFVGVDSDGTVFDSMKIKHTYSFIPAAVIIFGIEDYADAFKASEERINLYSLTRGINRFPGLLFALKEIAELGAEIGDLKDFEHFIESGYALSEKGVIEWLEKNPSEIMDKVLQWSRLSDSFFEKGTENLPPFDFVEETVDYMKDKADIMVVSAASSKGLEKDWKNAGLAEKVSFIAGQEFGKKKQQLLFAKEKGFEPEHMLMIGDAPGDYEAARDAGVKFYPIIPGRETECWEKLKSVYFDMFAEGKYTKETEKKLYDEFENFLKGEK